MDDKLCPHPRTGIVTSGSWTVASGSHAATDTCDQPGCIAAAVAWVNRFTQSDRAHYVPDEAS